MDYSIGTNKEEPQGGNHYEGDSTRILSMFFQIDAEYSERTNHCTNDLTKNGRSYQK